METIRVMIVEDIPLVAEDIASKLRANGLDVTGIHYSGEHALAAFAIEHPDLILMDIQLAGALDGISTAKIISDKYSVPLIYLSDHTEKSTVGRAKETHPAAYLAKPFNESDLIRTIEIAFSNFRSSGKASNIRDHLFVKRGHSMVKLAYSEIVYIEADRAYCTIVTEDDKYIQSISMNHVVEQIGHNDFVRVHRSAVVNVNRVTGIEGNIIHLGRYSVEMSKSMRDELISRLNIL
ncbi:MAG TPA: response regulator [Chryseolinea sp.]|nr:response regulator [Chryseolinea sp.]